MTFQEFNHKIMKDAILGRLLPLQLRRTYPRLTLCDSKLCAAFVGFRAVPGGNGVKALPPAYYLRITYPHCVLLSYEKCASGENGRQASPMRARRSEDIRRLSALCDEVLRLYDEKDPGIKSTISAYNELLNTILEPEQLAVLNCFENA